MSRSYKKTPYSGERKGKEKKRIANHKVRAWLKQHPEESLQGGKYKIVYETWDICDYGWTQTWEQYWESCWKWYRQRCSYFPNRDLEEPDYQKEYRRWKKYYQNK